MDNEVKDKEEKIIDKEKNPYGGYVSKIVLNDDVGISINESDIVVFVGPNNAGKKSIAKGYIWIMRIQKAIYCD